MLSQRRYRPWNRLALLWHQPRKISNGSNSCCIAMLGVSENGEMMFRFCLVIFLFYIKDWEKGGVISFRILCLNMSSDNIQCSTFHTSLSALDLMSSCIHTNLSLSFFLIAANKVLPRRMRRSGRWDGQKGQRHRIINWHRNRRWRRPPGPTALCVGDFESTCDYHEDNQRQEKAISGWCGKTFSCTTSIWRIE